ncbi:fimbria/pilus periplasmic chaperone [Lelliottia wanjuensis]|uniref:fimbria/pilus periplasmic chaperone n=1 Tax=Lelliottia wanjuensis TaxID=3050585 RepID=UPI00254D665C|nr:fimbria/pilus periplasmic chaperone [Lelliottia sp. V104_15]MDK9605797.1 fimbria/pilus periplasmic chaperone [Lelliottia sp. V104_15]
MKMKYCLISLLFGLPTFFSYAGGVSLETTRVIYPAEATQSSLTIHDTSKTEAFLIQSWVSDAEGEKSSDFIMTPPLFVIKPDQENILRLEMVGKPSWPDDRETLYYVNMKAIPSVPEGANKNSNTLQIATQTVIKMFVRPKGLSTSPDQASASLTCTYSGNSVVITNSSPYFVSLVNLKSGQQKIRSEMIAPKSQSTVKFDNPVVSLLYQSINDYGAIAADRVCK